MRAASPDVMATDPVGHYVSGEGFVHFCASPTLWGVILWGRPNDDIARSLGRTLVMELAPPATRHASVVDCSRIEGAEIGAFKALDWYMRTYSGPLAEQVSKLALVRPPGIPGAIVSGIYDMVTRPYPVEVFGSVEAALDWIGAPADLAATLYMLHAEASGTPPILGALRAWLATRLQGATLSDAARALSLSERSLQRKLGEAGTTFVAEIGTARVRAAQQLLVDTDTPLTTIALDVGCASLQHFSALFRKHVGESPSAWRRQRKAPASPG